MLGIGDIAAIYIKDKLVSYARLEGIEPDVKPRWYQVKFLFLSFPLKEVTWILKEEYINGNNFTIDGTPVHIVALPKPGIKKSIELPQKKQVRSHEKKAPASIISIDEIRKRKDSA
jgi:hypothetical protein